MKKIKLLFLVLLFSASSILAQEVKISGTVSNDNYTEIQVMDVLTGDVIATGEISQKKKFFFFKSEDYTFDFTLEIEQENIFALYLDDDHYILVNFKPGEKVEVFYDVSDYDAITIDGSAGTKLYMDYIAKVKTMTSIDEKMVYSDSLINANPDQFVSLLFGFSLGFDAHIDTHQKLINGLADDFSDNQIYKDYVSEFNSANATAIGSTPPDIELNNPDGEVVSLYSLRGQYVLLDFWAAWCRPCRGESPALVAAYNKYHAEGFTIYSVSLDQTKNDWIQAIENDELGAWPHVSDLQGWNSSAGRIYGVSSIPANFLLDPEGKIIAKNLRGASLEAKLADIFNQ